MGAILDEERNDAFHLGFKRGIFARIYKTGNLTE